MIPRFVLADMLYKWLENEVEAFVEGGSFFRLIKSTQPAEDVDVSSPWAFWSANQCNFKGYAPVAGPTGGEEGGWLPGELVTNRFRTEKIEVEFEYDAEAEGGVVGPQTARYVVWHAVDGDGVERVLCAWRLPNDKVFTNDDDKIKLKLSLSDLNIEHVA